MLISKFAKMFNVSTDTVRYYMQLGLLLPEKKNHYHYFDETCLEEMKWIQELKSFHFSLEEISKLLSIIRITSLTNEDDINFVIEMLADKKRELQQEVKQLNQICKMIDLKISTISTSQIKSTYKNGISFTFLPFLYCPTCQVSLELTNIETKGQQIFHGKIYCPNCSYIAKIEEGILITSHLNEHSFNQFYIYDIEMVKKIESSFVSLSEKASIYVNQRLLDQQLDGKVIMETNVDTYVFLDKYVSELQEDTYYIFTGSTLPMLKTLKRKIENSNPDLPVLYILNSGMNLPLKYSSIDYFIDSYSFNEFSLFHDTIPMKRLKPYLKENSLIIGCFFQYKEGSKTLREMKKLHPGGYDRNLYPNFINENLEFGGFDSFKKVLIGDTKDPGQYIKYHIPGEKAEFFVYTAQAIEKG